MNCTAPSRGHKTAIARKRCPICGPMKKEKPKVIKQHISLIDFDEITDYWESLSESYDNSSPLIDTEFHANTRSDITEYNKEWRELESRLSEEEKQSLHNYTGLTYIVTNEFLRDGDNFVENVDGARGRALKTIKHVDSIIDKAIPKERELFRYLDFPNNEMISSEERLELLGIREGETVTFNSYLSTTTDPALIQSHTNGDNEHRNIVFRFVTSEGIPVGENMEEVSSHSIQDIEREILVPRGKTFSVRRVCRARFVSDYGSSEPLTVFLEEK